MCKIVFKLNHQGPWSKGSTVIVKNSMFFAYYWEAIRCRPFVFGINIDPNGGIQGSTEIVNNSKTAIRPRSFVFSINIDLN